MPTTRYAKTGDGVHIAYQVFGEGPIDILVSGALWWHVEFQWTDPSMVALHERLARLGRVIVFDKRGTGLSDRVPVDRLPTLEARLDDLTAVLDAAGSSSAVLVGANHGAPLAILFAATFPDRTDSLILWGAYARCLEAADYPCGLAEHLASQVEARMEDHWDEPHGIEQLAPSAADDPTARSWWSTMQRHSVSPAAAVALWRMATATDVRDVLPAVHVPTLVMHLADDRLVDPGCGQHLVDNIEHARFVELPGADTNFVDLTPVADAIEEFLTGRIRAPEPDRALATVMFTDIVDSTAQLSRLGDREWRHVLDRHDALVERTLERHRGRKVKSTGDGVLATFDGPARAVRCAAAIRDGVEALDIQVRAGVHTGEVELRGDDVSGTAVHIGARVAALGAARDVLVTRTVVDLVAGSGLQFSDRGEVGLKGLPGRWQVFAVEAT